MKLKSITFRCTDTQQHRLEEEQQRSGMTRTDIICTALENFLRFSEQTSVKRLNLFELVAEIDTQCSGIRFSDEC